MDPYIYRLVDDDASKVIDHDLDILDFIKVNGLEIWEVEDMTRRFEDGKPSTHGGGASPQVSVIRSIRY